MTLTRIEISGLRAKADELGVDPDKLVAAAEDVDAGTDEAPASGATTKRPASSADLPPLYQYHLPFLLVRELRARLGFTERIDDDEELCSAFALKHGVAPAPTVGGTEGTAP